MLASFKVFCRRQEQRDLLRTRKQLVRERTSHVWRAWRSDMEVLHPRCAGLDVHKDRVVACARHLVDGAVKCEVRTFATTTRDVAVLGNHAG
jgi:hypothetical protein